jgi:predicted RNA methylase
VVAKQVGGKVHPLGVAVRTDDLLSLLQVRTYREMLFPIPVKELLPEEEVWRVWESMLALCRKYHREDTPFYFRVECKAGLSLEERSRFTKRLGARLEQLSGGALINATGDYEVELRLIAGRDGRFFPCLKFYTLPDKRFAYRKNAIATSIHPSTAALIMELAAPYLKEDAQIMDPFCGVGTMLIERDIRVPARQMYATDIFGDAITGARENAALAGEQIHFIHRDFFDFRHDYKFDELITNMPVRGKMSREELDGLYADFFDKVLELTEKEAVLVLYTGEVGFVKKQIRLHKEFSLQQEFCMQAKTGFYLLIIRARS